jgi:hypothetical protein
MTIKTGLKRLTGALTVMLLVAATAEVFSFKIQADNDGDIETFTVDIAQYASTYVQNDVNPSEGQEVFSRGDTFIVEGTIYPAGSLPGGKADNDPHAPGSIGKYRMRGTFTTDFANFERAVAGSAGADPVLGFASELYSFPDDLATVLTDGIWPNAHFSGQRQVLGGTGRFHDIVGEVNEENIGENKDGFCNLRVTFQIRKVAGNHNH